MALRNWDAATAIREISRLTAPGVLGFYTHFEATEVFAQRGKGVPFNVFTILVAEERSSDSAEKSYYLTPKPIKVKSLRGWNFGVKRYVKPMAELVPLLDALRATKEWRGSGLLLQTGDLLSVPPQFVPPDSSGSVPWNRVLKNNFWNGSHVFEWADPGKSALQPLFDDPPQLQELSESVRAVVPVGLASLSDRLGNIAVQLPVTVLIAKFAELRESSDFQVSLAWHTKAVARTLRASCTMNYDDAIPAFGSVAAGQDAETVLPMYDGPGLNRATLWDDENHILLAATGDMSFVRSIVMNMHILDPEPRVFSVPDGNGGEELVRFNLTPKPVRNVIGEPATKPAGESTQRRMYREETDRLRTELRFVSYKPKRGKSLRPKALEDVRALINRHGEDGVWLWDPFLSVEDVINTLFYCRFAGAELRALTAGDSPPGEEQALDASVSPAVEFSAKQKKTLAKLKSNLRGLNLEFRIRTGSAGWAFHDRFLIFPGADRAGLAWSLGTSINSLGRQHHILQRVDDGQRIIDDFTELWDALRRPEHLIWKTP